MGTTTRRGRTRWAIFIHEPDGDSGEGCIVGAFLDAGAADRKAEQITQAAERRGEYLECIVLPMSQGGTSAKRVVDEVIYR